MKAGSLRLRLLLAAAISIIVALAAAELALATLFRQQVQERVMQELNNDLLQLAGAIELLDTGEIKVTGTLADPRYQQPFGGKYWVITRMGGTGTTDQPPLRSRSYWDTEPSAANPGTGPESEKLVHTERIVSIKGKEGEVALKLQVGVHESEVTSPLASFRSQLLPYLALLATALIIAAWVQVAVGLRPLAALRNQLAELRNNRTQRLQGQFPSELEPLVSELNEVLVLRDTSLERARRRAGDLAHGLMTPLTILSGLARNLRKGKRIKEAEDIELQISSMQHHVERSLVRARLATGRGHDLANLHDAVQSVMATLSRVPGTSHISWSNAVPTGAKVPVERNDLLELLGNLMDNARKFARSEVSISLSGNSLVVEDDGPGVQVGEFDTIRERGKRLDESRKGFGLGLAIVGDIADIYELSLTFGTSDMGGLRIEVAFGNPAG